MEITNKQKAEELAKKFDWHAFIADDYLLEKCIEEAMVWKGKQMVSRAKTFLKEIARICDITDENGYRIDERYLLAELEKALKGE